jgi:hypothetical protein
MSASPSFGSFPTGASSGRSRAGHGTGRSATEDPATACDVRDGGAAHRRGAGEEVGANAHRSRGPRKRGEPQATDFGGLSLNPLTQPADLEEREFQKATKEQEERRQREEAQLAALREKKRLAEAAAKAS